MHRISALFRMSLYCALMALLLTACFEGDRGERGPQGLQGEIGPQGDQGAPGLCDCARSPAGHWVLRDADGAALEYEIYTNENTNNPPTDYINNFGEYVEKPRFGCVALTGYGRYDVETGEMLSCYGDGDSVRRIFLDDECSGDFYKYVQNGNNEQTIAAENIKKYRGDDVLYSAWGAPDIKPAADEYRYYERQPGGSCSPVNITQVNYLWRMRPVPDEVLNLLPNPPYKLSYEFY